jgi:hypothetical protein
MSDVSGRKRFELQVPADPAQVATVRLFVATTARATGLGEDVVADLKLAVSEAASAVVSSGRHDSILVEIVLESGRLTVSVAPLTEDALTGDHLHPGDIIAALFPTAHFDDDLETLLIPVVREPAQ